jgi:PadR family transcriptional regulator PadR
MSSLDTFVEMIMPELNAIQEHLPLTEASLYILLSLASRSRHGYAIMKDVQSLSKGGMELSTGTLYGALKRMHGQGWITPVEARESVRGEGSAGRERKAYALTQYGRRVLEAEICRINRLGEIAQGRIAESGP